MQMETLTSPLATDESILVTFSYYLGRIDRIFLTKDGAFQVKYGEPSERPVRPGPVDDAIEIATITLPPYLYRTQEAGLSFLEQKRYRMSDIRRLENRIRNLEYYTALSLLETNTANLFVPDSEGLTDLSLVSSLITLILSDHRKKVLRSRIVLTLRTKN